MSHLNLGDLARARRALTDVGVGGRTVAEGRIEAFSGSGTAAGTEAIIGGSGVAVGTCFCSMGGCELQDC